jgi:aminoglycoside/choline kinase family phosphotransferase
VTGDELTPEILTRLLAAHLGDARVTDVDIEVVGTGQMAECCRLRLSYDKTGAGPTSVVAKLPSGDAASRAAAVAVRAYEVEVNVYRQLQPTLLMRAPQCYFAHIDLDANDFVLLLEDVAPARQGDQLSGCSADEAAVAIAELPGLHAPRWGDETLNALDWLHRNTPETRGFLGQLLRLLHPGFVERYADRLSPDVLRMSERVVDAVDHLDDRPRPWTVTHGDYRLDNLLFGAAATDRVVVVDWQTAGLGPGVADLSYFLGGSLISEERRANEEALVRDYHQRMLATGIPLTWDALWQQYRRYSVSGLVMAIAASMMVKRTARGDDMFVTMAERAGQHAVDLEAVELLR